MVVRLSDVKKYLNRDGLEEYNSLLPHSSEEMQEYVNDWLDEHPEATTTVQDGAITEPKLADNSVSLRTLADDTVHMLKGMILTREISGDMVAASDAYAAPPVALTVKGKSEQDGTPTPDNPIDIENIEAESVYLTYARRNIFDTNFTQTYTKYDFTIENDGTGIFKVTTTITSGGLRARAFGKTKEIFGGGAYPTDFSIDPNTAVHLPAGTYKVVGSTSVSNTHICIRYGRAGDTGGNARNVENGATITSDGSLYYYGCIYTTNAGSIPASGLRMFVMLIRSEVAPPSSYEPYTADVVTAPTSGHILRALPNGGCDKITHTYLRPSAREGYAWYARKLTTLVGRYDVTEFTSLYNNAAGNQIAQATIPDNERVYLYIYTGAGHALRGMSNRFTAEQSSANYLGKNNFNYYGSRGWLSFGFELDTFADLAAANAWLANNPLYVLMQLTTPTTEILAPIELPIMPAPNFTIWNDRNTGMQLEYARDSNLVIQRIEEAIADL